MAADPDLRDGDVALVWGNCQGGPMADLLRAPLAAVGVRVEPVPPVYLAAADDVRRVHELARRCAVFVTQPVSEDYPEPGCGSEYLIGLLPPHARVVRFPVVHDVGAFPFQARGYTGDGGRIDAPITDYHDLRVVLAAARGWSTARTLAGWAPADPRGWRAVADASRAELRRREAGQDVIASDLVRGPDAMWTMTHPANVVLGELARRALGHLGVPGTVEVPRREYLGQRRAPVDPPTAQALGWSHPRASWVVDGRRVPRRELVERQLAFYRDRPDVITETLRRNQDRIALLEPVHPAA